MKILICFALFLAGVVTGLVCNWPPVVAVAWGLLLFALLGLSRGYSLKSLWAMSWKEGKKMLIVLRILTLIGIITGLWRVGGTIAYIIYYGLQFITPPLFILVAFLLPSLISYALGTSFGVVGTIGVILMVLARSGGVSEAITAGAVLSGAYFGDRCSPASSCASLVAAVTETELYPNVKNMLKTGALPFAVSTAFYAVLSVRNPLQTADDTLARSLAETYRLSPWVLIPAVLMILLPLCHVPIRPAMGVSIAASAVTALLVQQLSVGEIVRAALLGVAADGTFLGDVMAGGGLISMIKSLLLVPVTGLFAGLMDGLGVLGGVHGAVERVAEKIGLFGAMTVATLLSAMVFCNQSIAVMLGPSLLRETYRRQGASAEEMAIDLENSGVMLSGLVPWSIACSVPLDMLNVNAAALPYAALLYATPLVYGLTKKWFYKREALQK